MRVPVARSTVGAGSIPAARRHVGASVVFFEHRRTGIPRLSRRLTNNTLPIMEYSAGFPPRVGRAAVMCRERHADSVQPFDTHVSQTLPMHALSPPRSATNRLQGLPPGATSPSGDTDGGFPDPGVLRARYAGVAQWAAVITPSSIRQLHTAADQWHGSKLSSRADQGREQCSMPTGEER